MTGRSLGALELEGSEIEDLIRKAGEYARTRMAPHPESPVYPRVDYDEVGERVAEPLPRAAMSGDDLLREFEAVVDPYTRDNNHSRMFGYIVSPATFPGALGDFLTSVLNQNVTSWRSAPGPTVVERLVVDWIKEAVGFPSGGEGILLSGGSMANFVALLTALQARTEPDLRIAGVRSLDRDPVVYASEMVHGSVAKAAALAGLGTSAVRTLPATGDYTLDPARVDEAVAEDRTKGRLPLALVANAGDVNVGTVDPLADLAAVAREHGLWYHVDGAYGGFAAGVPSLRPRFRGIEEADSLTLDPHKWLFIPLDAGCLLVRESGVLTRAFSQHSAAYMEVLDQPSEYAFWDRGPELSRRFRGLKIWLTLKRFGFDAIAGVIEDNVRLAGELGEKVQQAWDFELMAPPELSIVCFRYLPPGARGDPGGDERRGQGSSPRDLNALNRAITVEIQRGGYPVYLSNTNLDGVFVLRACLVSHRTRPEDLDGLLETIREVARRVMRDRRE